MCYFLYRAANNVLQLRSLPSYPKVPWKLIPFLIVVLGVDNMFVLTTSVSGTSINLPVKERVAEGLGQSGLSIFLNLLAELGALWALYLAIPTRVIREMVVFGAVALVMDYMMEMTYFLTVLSIDMQRLELADLIRQETRMPIKSASHRKDVCTKSIPRLIEGVLDSIRQRTARTYSAIIVSQALDVKDDARRGSYHLAEAITCAPPYTHAISRTS